MPLHSAGILLYRRHSGVVQVLLVHPGGPYFAKKDAGAWGIPKGLLEEGEDGLTAARREFEEELGIAPKAKTFIPLTSIKQKGGKIVHAWAAKGELDATAIRSNIFRMEHPYKSGHWIEVPEVDRAEWFSLEAAAEKIIPAQQPLLTELAALLAVEQ